MNWISKLSLGMQARAILGGLMLAGAGLISAQTVPTLGSATGAVAGAGEAVFVAGSVVRRNAVGATEKLSKGGLIQEGDQIDAGADGYVYVRMADGGLLVVRPLSKLRIDRWYFNPAQPALTEIRYTLGTGVARYVSGEGSRAAKDKFRFNTPLAAIGVRGTDFTVFSDQDFTRVSVRSGGVVVSPVGTVGCRADGFGPCEGEQAAELFASFKEKMVQIRPGQARAELVDISGVPSPDKARPPLPAEPVSSNRPSPATNVAIEDYRMQQWAAGSTLPGVVAEQVGSMPVPVPVPVPMPVPDVGGINAVWGRTASAHGSEVARMALDDILEGRSLIATNRYYAVAGNRDRSFVLPNAGSVEFKLVGHQGIILDNVNDRAMDSVASNGTLRIDFVNRQFATNLNIQAQNVSASIEAKGGINKDGSFLSTPFKSPALVQGLVGGSGASEAVYLYRQTLSKQFEAAGVASWGK